MGATCFQRCARELQGNGEGRRMPYELVLDTVQPGRVYDYMTPLENANRQTGDGDCLVGCWTTDDDTAYSGFGVLNQLYHLWEVGRTEDAARRSVLEACAALRVARQVDVLTPARFMKSLEPQAAWPMYELVIDTVRSGTLAQAMDAWERGLPTRLPHGPLAGCWTRMHGELEQVVHLWGCPGLRNRERIRNSSWKPGLWPPARDLLVSQENRLLVPAVFASEPSGRRNLAAPHASTAPSYVPGPSAGRAPG